MKIELKLNLSDSEKEAKRELDNLGNYILMALLFVFIGGVIILFLSHIPVWLGWITQKTALMITGILTGISVGILSSYILLWATFNSLKNLWRMNKIKTLIGVIVFVIAVWIVIAWIT